MRRDTGDGKPRDAQTRPNHRAEIGRGDLPASRSIGWRAGLVSNPIHDAALIWSVVVLIIISRWLAFPASIWDMDEANFTLGVLSFDPIHNQPHAPFFPLWIALGKIVRWVVPGCGPAVALQLVSTAFSVWILWPLWALWSAILPRIQAFAAATLYVALPGPWLLSGRAYTEPTATALMIAGLVLWLPRRPSRSRLILGGVSVAGALLVRPQWLVVVVPLIVWRVVRSRGAIERTVVVGVPAVIGGVVVAVVAAASGGLNPLWAAIQQHRKYMAGASEGFQWGFSDLAVHAACGGVIAGTLWLSFVILGCFVMFRDRATRADTGVVIGLVAAPLVLLLLTTQNPTVPRYALPLLALTSGPVVVGISALIQRSRWTLVAVGGWVVVSIVLTAPALARYRNEPSPIVAALNRVESNPAVRIVAVDRRMVAFVTLERAAGRLGQQLVWDYQVELGMVESPFRSDLAAIATERDPGWIIQPGRVTDFRCDQQLLRRVASPRFLDMTVVEGCGLVRPDDPSVRPEDLRPGAVVPAR